MHRIGIPPARFTAFMAEPVPAVKPLSTVKARRVAFGTFAVPLRPLLREAAGKDRTPETKEANYAERFFA